MSLSPGVEEKIKLFGKTVRRFRNEKGWTMKRLAEIAEIELSQIHRIETGKINPKLSTIFILSEALDVKPSELLVG
ncbi:MAG TPA: helix-turn-helix transcriptional regulator [Pedobacter sp.]|jgi:transcriptional regulator with XRE-family HTH domain